MVGDSVTKLLDKWWEIDGKTVGGIVVPIFPWFESSISHNDLCRAGFIKYKSQKRKQNMVLKKV